ncbi:MAG: hemolysin family protein [Acidimicrobiia bacterium]
MACVVVLLLANAVFVAGEFSLVAADRSKVALAADAGSRRARVVQGLQRHLSFNLSGTQLGITVTSLVLGLLTEPVVAEALRGPVDAIVSTGAVDAVSVAVALVLVTTVQMVVAELVPKNVAVARPQPTALLLGPLLRVYAIVFGPAITVLSRAAGRIVRMLGIEPRETHDIAPSAIELASMIKESATSGVIGAEATRLLTRTLRFTDKTAADALVSRLTVEAIDASATVADLAELAVSTGYSRFPVIDGDLDQIVGVVLAKDVFRVPAPQRSTREVRELASAVLAVPDTRDLESLLAELRAGAGQLVVVVDEFGSTAGIVTLEDVLEELVGEIDDEYDEPPRFTRLARGAIALDGTARADDVEEACGLIIPDGEYETLAGFVLTLLEHIPVVGEIAHFADWELEVLEMDRHRIARVVVRRLELPSVDQVPGTGPTS